MIDAHVRVNNSNVNEVVADLVREGDLCQDTEAFCRDLVKEDDECFDYYELSLMAISFDQGLKKGRSLAS